MTVAEAGHVTAFWMQYARNLISQFIETLRVGNTSCADTPETIFPAVARFPLLANEAWPADIEPNGNNQFGLAERKVVSAGREDGGVTSVKELFTQPRGRALRARSPRVARRTFGRQD